MFVRAGGSMAELMAWGRWRSLHVARKYVARWDAMPWIGGCGTVAQDRTRSANLMEV